MNILKNTIKHRLQNSFLLFVILSCVGGGISFYLLGDVIDYADLNRASQELSKHLMNARKAEADFLNFDVSTEGFHLEGKSQGINEFETEMKKIDSLLSVLSQSDHLQRGSLMHLYPEIERLSNGLKAYENTFENIISKYKERGFKDYGLEGAIREHVHKLQDCRTDAEKVFALTLRKHEKDYFIRNDLKYVDKLKVSAQKFKVYLVAQYGENERYAKTHSATIDAYVKGFERIVAIEKEIGLDNEKGLLADLDRETSGIIPKLNTLSITIKKEYEKIRYQTFAILAFTSIVLLVLGLWLSMGLSKQIATPISTLTGEVVAYMEGTKAEKVLKMKENVTEEVKSLANNFRSLMERTDKNMKEISEKNRELEVRAKEESERRWVNEGIAKVSDITRQVANLDDLSHEVIVSLVKLTGSNQGAIFTVGKNEKDAEYLEMKGCYAYNRKKYLEKKIYPGEGLIGAAYYEKDTIYMQQLPEDYINITSGLGDAPPRNVLIVPIMDEEKVEGVIELASFEIYSEHQKELVMKVAERLASVIGNLRTKVETERLLKESQMMTENLRASEEELRQNFEELEATQEELNRLGKESEEKVQSLKSEINIMDAALLANHDGYMVFDGNNKLISKKVNNLFDKELSLEATARHILSKNTSGEFNRAGTTFSIYSTKLNDNPFRIVLLKKQVEELV